MLRVQTNVYMNVKIDPKKLKNLNNCHECLYIMVYIKMFSGPHGFCSQQYLEWPLVELAAGEKVHYPHPDLIIHDLPAQRGATYSYGQV